MENLIASIVVPVRNGGAHVPGLVAALAAQTVPRERFEVVIADDGSTDGSLSGLEAYDGWLRVLSGPPRNSYEARNRGFRAARAPLIAFCDIDCRPEPTWLEAGLAALEGADIAAGLVRFIVPERPTTLMLLDAEASLDHEAQVRSGHASTVNLFVRREVLERSGGFDDRLPSGSDWWFVGRCIRDGARLVYAPAAVVTHPVRGGRAYLGKLWFRSRWAATRGALAGARPDLLAAVVPAARAVKQRRSSGRPLTLDRRRLAEHGIEPTTRQQVTACGARYVLLPALVYVARAWGWADGMGRRRAAGSGPH
jgi:glycosyltransferase involved in cell wall biosynthesis